MADRDLVRRWVGSSPDDDAIDIVLARDDIDSPEAAALDILYSRRADIVGGHSSFAIDGDARWTRDVAAALKALDSVIGRLEAALGLDSTSTPTLHVAPIEGPRSLR